LKKTSKKGDKKMKQNRKQDILGKAVEQENRQPNTLAQAGVKIYSGVFFKVCFPDIASVVIDSTAKLMIQPQLKQATSLQIVAAVEKCQLVAGTSRNQLACFLLDNVGRDGWFLAHVEDIIRDEADEADLFVSKGGERLVLRTVGFFWHIDGWRLNAYRISDPYEWGAGIQVISRNPSVS
jgi:hypothetical protein